MTTPAPTPDATVVTVARIDERLGFITTQLEQLTRQVGDRQDRLEKHVEKLTEDAQAKHTELEHRLEDLERWKAKAYGVLAVLTVLLGASGWYTAFHQPQPAATPVKSSLTSWHGSSGSAPSGS